MPPVDETDRPPRQSFGYWRVKKSQTKGIAKDERLELVADGATLLIVRPGGNLSTTLKDATFWASGKKDGKLQLGGASLELEAIPPATPDDLQARLNARHESELARHLQVDAQALRQATTLQQVLVRHLEATIGINYKDPAKVEAARLTAVGDGFLSVLSPDGLLYHFPFSAVLSVAEAPGGMVKINGNAFPVSVVLNHLIIYQGSRSVGFQIPLD